MSGARFDIRLKPRSKNDRISLADGNRIDVAVTSPPIDDRANKHLMELLADRLDVAKGSVTIIKGGHSKNKVVEITGMTKDEVLGRLQKGS